MGCNVSKDVKVEDQGNAENRIGGEGDKCMSEEKAAEKIQASFRGYKTRKSLKNNGALPAKTDVIENKPNGEIEEKVKEFIEKPKEESASKPNSANATVPDELLDIDLTDVDLEKAATKIQASYRNFTKKKQEQATTNSPIPPEQPEVKASVNEQEVNEKTSNSNTTNKEEEENLEDIDLEDPEVEKAALKIQSTFRGYKIRKEINTDEKPIENGEKAEEEE